MNKKPKYRKSNIPVKHWLKGKRKNQAIETEKGRSVLSFIKPKSKFHQ